MYLNLYCFPPTGRTSISRERTGSCIACGAQAVIASIRFNRRNLEKYDCGETKLRTLSFVPRSPVALAGHWRKRLHPVVSGARRRLRREKGEERHDGDNSHRSGPCTAKGKHQSGTHAPCATDGATRPHVPVSPRGSRDRDPVRFTNHGLLRRRGQLRCPVAHGTIILGRSD